MKAWIGRIVVLGLLAGAGFWAWKHFFPSPEKAIRERLLALARTVSFSGQEGELARVDNAQRVTTFFTPDLKVIVDVPGMSRVSFGGRDELFQAAMGARTRTGSLKVEFPGISIKLGPDKTTALVEVTARGNMGGGEEFVQELRFSMKKVGRNWLITVIETLRTLT